MGQTQYQTVEKSPRRKSFNFPRWLPVTLSVILLVVVALVATVTMIGLKRATYWRQHTFQTILAAQSFRDTILEIQRGMRSYTLSDDTNALARYENAIQTEPARFQHLVELTRDNSEQQRRLKTLEPVMIDLLARDALLIDAYNLNGTNAPPQANTNSIIRLLNGQALDILKAFSDEEQKLLNVREASERANYHYAGQLLIVGSALAAILLLLANFMASHELTQRQRTETKLNQALLLQKAILNSSDYGIITTDPKGIVQTYNSAAEKLLGYSAEEIIGKATPMLWRDPKEIAERAHQLSLKFGMPVRPTFESVAMKVQFDQIDEGEWTFIRKGGGRFTSLLVVNALSDEAGNFTGFLGIFRDISQRKQSEMEREKLVVELQQALAQVKTLSGLIPICAWCKNIRNDKGYWQNVEEYVHSHSDATFSHGICPGCTKKFQAELAKANNLSKDSSEKI